MKLVELEPRWIAEYNPATRSLRQHLDVRCDVPHDDDRDLTALAVEQVQGVMFLCPVCFAKNGGPVGTEHVLCWFKGRGVPDDAVPGPGRWDASGTSFADLTLSPSVNVAEGHWHGFIRNGEVTNA